MVSESSEGVSGHVVTLSKEGLSQHHIMTTLKVKGGGFTETESVVSKARSGRPRATTPSEDQSDVRVYRPFSQAEVLT